MRMEHRVVVTEPLQEEEEVATGGVQEDPMTEMCLDRMVGEEEDSNQEMTGKMRKWIELEE